MNPRRRTEFSQLSPAFFPPCRLIPSLLLSLSSISPTRCFPTWKELTGVSHGLFPEDDAQLPNGWTRDMATQVSSYFDQYHKKKSETQKMKFAAYTRKIGKDIVPGRAIFRTYVTERYSKTWNLHGIISGVLSDNDVHPTQLMSAMGSFATFPSSALYLPGVLDVIGLALYGPDSIDRTNHLRYELREATLILAQSTWANLNKAHNRDTKRLDKFETKVKDAFKGKHPTHILCPWADCLASAQTGDHDTEASALPHPYSWQVVHSRSELRKRCDAGEGRNLSNGTRENARRHGPSRTHQVDLG